MVEKNILSAVLLSLVWCSSNYCMDYNQPKFKNKRQLQTGDGKIVMCDLNLCQLLQVVRNGMKLQDISEVIKLSNVTEDDWKVLQPVLQLMASVDIEALYIHVRDCSLDKLNNLLRLAIRLGIRTEDNRINLSNIISHVIEQQSSHKNEENHQDQTPQSQTVDKNIDVQEKTKEKEKKQSSSITENNLQHEHVDGIEVPRDSMICKLSRVINEQMKAFDDSSDTIPLPKVTEAAWKLLKPFLIGMSEGDNNIFNQLDQLELPTLLTIVQAAEYLDIRTTDNKIILAEVIAQEIARKLLTENSKNKFLESEKFLNDLGLSDILLQRVARRIFELSPNVKARILQGVPVLSKDLQGHTGFVWSAAFNRTGDKIVSAGDLTVRIWDVNTGTCKRVLQGHTGFVWSAAFNRTRDKVVSAGDLTVRIWDVKMGTCERVLQGHTFPNTDIVYSAAFNRTGDKIVSASRVRIVRIWDVKMGTCERVLQGHTDIVYSAAFNRTGDKIVSASSDKTVRIWDVKTGICDRVLQGHTEDVYSAAFDRTGERIVSASMDGTVRIWDVKTGTCERILQGHTEDVKSAAFNRTGDKIASASRDRTVRIWDVKTGTCERVLQGYTGPVISVAFNRTGDKMVSASSDGTISIWDLNNLLALQQYLENNFTLDQALLLVCWHDAQTNNRQLNISQNYHLQEIYDSIDSQEIRDIVRHQQSNFKRK